MIFQGAATMKNQGSEHDDRRAGHGLSPQSEQDARDHAERQAEAHALIARVRQAFADVKLGSGVGLHEGQALDDYGNAEAQQAARDTDEKEDWRKLLAADLEACDSSLSYFDPEGMRFHLPAFLIGEIEGSLENSLSMRFSAHPDFNRSPFSLLNAEQRAVVEDCLVYLERAWNESAG